MAGAARETGIPVVISGLLSAFFVVCVNSWMNQPQGYSPTSGTVTATFTVRLSSEMDDQVTVDAANATTSTIKPSFNSSTSAGFRSRGSFAISFKSSWMA